MHILPFILMGLLYYFLFVRNPENHDSSKVRSEGLWELLDYYLNLPGQTQDEFLGSLSNFQRNDFLELTSRYQERGDVPRKLVTPQLIETLDTLHWNLMARSMMSHLALFNALSAEAQDFCLKKMGDDAGNFCALNNFWLDNGQLPQNQPELWATRQLRAAVDEALSRFYHQLETDTLHIDRAKVIQASRQGLIFLTGGYLADNPAKTLTVVDEPKDSSPAQ